MRILKKTIFWAHLVAGLTAGLVILVLAVTGVLMSYERQIIEWTNDVTVSDGSGGALGPEALLRPHLSAKPAPTAVLLQRNPEKPVALQFGRTKTVYLDPSTGESLGEGNQNVRGFFKWVLSLHRWLAMSGDSQKVGKGVIGAANLVFLFLVISGIWLWFPRRWTRSNLRAITMLQGRLKGRARDWNWHNVFGFWACLPLFFIVITGTIMAYPWATGLLYRMVGENPPPPREKAGPPAGARPMGGEKPGGAAGMERNRGGGEHSHEPVNLAGLDAGLTVVKEANPAWETIRVEVPSGKKPVVYNVSFSHRGRPDLAQQVSVDLRSATVVKSEGLADQTLGRKLRVWSRWVHTGEAGGWLGQAVAGLSAAAAAVLVWTGFALSFRRFFKRRRIKLATNSEA